MNKKSIMGIVGILIVLIFVSGCINNTNTNSTSKSKNGHPSVEGAYPDIVMANTPSPYLLSDGSVYSVGGLLQNSGQKTYKNVLLQVNGLDESGNVVSSKKTMIANMPPGTTVDYSVYLDVPSDGQKIIGADLKVLNATVSS